MYLRKKLPTLFSAYKRHFYLKKHKNDLPEDGYHRPNNDDD